MENLTADTLRRELDYDPETGVFTRRIARGGQKVGSVAGWLGKNGYWYINVAGGKHSAHRLAWLHVHGEWPSMHLDHLNRSPTDNRIANLRDVTRSVNMQNSKVRADNTTGHPGVYWFPRTSKWMAAVFEGGRQVHLGYYPTKEEAIDARRRAMEARHEDRSSRAHGCSISTGKI